MAKNQPKRIQFVKDARTTPPVLAMSDDIFAGFDVATFCTFRDLVAETRDDGVTLIACGHCGAPVYPSCTGQERIRRQGGDAIYFKHHAGGDAELCPSGADCGIDPDLHDRKRFDGIQEGVRHAELKSGLAAALEDDPRASDVAIERVHFHDRRPRRPDVSALFDGHRLAIEIQLADPQFVTVRKRDAFDRAAGLVTVWAMDHDRIRDLARHVNFAAIAVRQDGHIIAWSEAAVAASHVAGRVLAHLMTLAPSGVTSSRLVDLSEALVAIGVVPARPAAIPSVADGWIAATDRVTDLRTAMLSGDRDGAAALAGAVAVAGGLQWDETAWRHDLVEFGIGACLVALTGRKARPSGYRDRVATQILNSFLEQEHYRAWTPILIAVCGGHASAKALLSVPKTASKVARNLTAIAEAPDETARLAERWSPFLRAVFPKMRGVVLPVATVLS